MLFRSGDVLQLQQLLQQLGYFPAGTEPTGYFGPVTLNAVRLYQAANGISTTGYVGPLTRSALTRLSGSATNELKIGDRVETAASLNVRETPNGTVIGRQSLRALGTVIGGPTPLYKDYLWYKVNYDAEPDGWSAGAYLERR